MAGRKRITIGDYVTIDRDGQLFVRVTVAPSVEANPETRFEGRVLGMATGQPPCGCKYVEFTIQDVLAHTASMGPDTGHQ